MKRQFISRGLAGLMSLGMLGVLAGCSVTAELQPSNNVVQGVAVKAVGLGAEPNRDGLSDEQKMLLAIKASKMDAYRSLVEKVYGVEIKSGVSIRSLAVDNDSFKARVEGMIQMAEVKEIRPISEGAYETTMEVMMTPEFRDYVLKQHKGSD